jgi:dienelactone hydrolase
MTPFRLAAPLFAVGGVDDNTPSPAVLGQLLARLAVANKTATVKAFADAGHAFLADYRDSHRDQPAQEPWADVTGFFTHHLRSGS